MRAHPGRPELAIGTFLEGLFVIRHGRRARPPLAGRVVAVTGAGAGVGRAVARAFAAQGADVALLARGGRALDAAADEVERFGGRALVVPVDMGVPDRVEEAAERVERELGPVDVWVNSAVTSVLARFPDVTPEEYARVTTVTYLGCVNGTRAALRRMRPRDAGAVVQVGSVLGELSVPLQAACCGAEHAIRGFTASVRMELRHEGSRVAVTTVRLPVLDPEPEAAARAVVHAARHPRRAAYRVGASTAVAALAHRTGPALLDRCLARTAEDGKPRRH
ncbi:SDR family oxidoreductase [Streptomyces sp. NPDC020807]|uniref:SDR family oxidoreductase n=1 Tax=Streptomyces sp. NPDC020807 TaxID=3155119 RepID=UPI003410DB73